VVRECHLEQIAITEKKNCYQINSRWNSVQSGGMHTALVFHKAVAK